MFETMKKTLKHLLSVLPLETFWRTVEIFFRISQLFIRDFQLVTLPMYSLCQNKQ